MSEFTIEEGIGRRIQNLRKEKGFTQQELAEAIGISTNYLSDVERGNKLLRTDKIIAIINVLKCTSDDIFADVIDTGYLVKSSRLSDSIQNLPPKEQEKILAVIKILALGS